MGVEEFIEKYDRSSNRKMSVHMHLIFDGMGIKELKEKLPHHYANFENMNHDSIRSFFEMSDEDKFLYAYCAQRIKSEEKSKFVMEIGFFLGCAITITVVGIFLEI
jgi:hypothetical protein